VGKYEELLVATESGRGHENSELPKETYNYGVLGAHNAEPTAVTMCHACKPNKTDTLFEV
jgi:hypothetical protein